MIDFAKVKNEAVGKWPGIYAALGIEVGDGRHGKCPICGHEKNFRMDDKNGNGTFICTCSSGDGWTLLQTVLGCDFKSAIEQVFPIVGTVKKSKCCHEKNIDPKILREMFLNSTKITKDDLVGQYLKSRGLNLFPDPLRYSKECWEPETKKNQHAMLGIVTLPDGEAVTIHRTYLDVNTAGKLNIEKPKKLMPGLKKITGGAIRLFEVEDEVGIAEGIETAIECTDRFSVPTWAAVSSTILEGFIPPVGIKKVYVFGDNDKNFTGQKSAYILANKLVLKHKVDVEVFIPNKIGDWLDCKGM